MATQTAHWSAAGDLCCAGGHGHLSTKTHLTLRLPACIFATDAGAADAWAWAAADQRLPQQAAAGLQAGAAPRGFPRPANGPILLAPAADGTSAGPEVAAAGRKGPLARVAASAAREAAAPGADAAAPAALPEAWRRCDARRAAGARPSRLSVASR